MYKTIYFIIMLILSVSELFASDKEVALNVVIGVGPVDCISCSVETQDLISQFRKNIHEQLVKSPALRVTALNDMDAAIASEVRGQNEPMESWASRIGKKAGVEKIVFAVITENEKKYVTDKTVRFKITVYTMDIKTGALEIVQPVETDLSDDFEKIFINAGDSIVRIYHGHSEITEKTDAAITVSYLYPQADLRSGGAGNGYGVSFNLYLQEPAWLLLTIGAFYFETERDDIKSLAMLPFGIHVPFHYPVTLNFKVIPSIGFGGLVSLMEYDEFRYRYPHEYHTEIFFNPLITARIELNYTILNRYAFLLTPSFSYIVGEEDRMGFIFSLDLGYKIHF